MQSRRKRGKRGVPRARVDLDEADRMFALGASREHVAARFKVGITTLRKRYVEAGRPAPRAMKRKR